MKAAVYTEYGPPEVLRIAEVAKPSPKANELLVRIRATAVNSGDWRIRKADPYAVRFVFGLRRPKRPILGTVFSGEVESVGIGVQQFKSGDLVFGHTDMRFGAYAEYICVPENGSVVLKPGGLTHHQAAAIPFGALTALHFLKKAAIRKGQKVLVIGASGAVGSAAVQLAHSFGAIVTGVCSAANMPLVSSLGARQVIDYQREDFSENGVTYDVIFDTVNAVPVRRMARSLAPGGTMILSAAGIGEALQAKWIAATSRRKLISGVTRHTNQDLLYIESLVEAGKFRAVVDRTYPLAQIAEAHAYVEQQHKKGNVVVDVS